MENKDTNQRASISRRSFLQGTGIGVASFAALGLLGGRRGTLAFLIYLLLGIVGLPVFSGFSAGAGVLFGATGGYLLGYLAAALLFWGLTAKLGQTLPVMASAMVLGLVLCYAGFSPSTPAAAGRPCWAP